MNKTPIYIDPPYNQFYKNNFFRIRSNKYNRDNNFLPNFMLKKYLMKKGVQINTADFLFQKLKKNKNYKARYYSFGVTKNLKKLRDFPNVSFEKFFAVESPLIAPRIFNNIYYLSKIFKFVYVHNPFEYKKIYNIEKFYCPLPYNRTNKYWNKKDRLHKIVFIGSNHNPWIFAIKNLDFSYLSRELYSTRINLLAFFSNKNFINCFGNGWTSAFSISKIWPTYIKNYFAIKKTAKGPIKSKYKILSRYKYSLCIENLSDNGYISEKIFDCLYSGTVPVYLGPSDIYKYLPKNIFIDINNFSSLEDLFIYLNRLPESKFNHFRNNGRKFLESKEFNFYFNFLTNNVP
jgi:alpha(1,3/1,4) fucosyltransferase